MSFLWNSLVRRAAFALDAERAHELGIAALERGLAAPFYCEDNTFGFDPIELFGLKFANPLGIAAGFDKNGLVVDPLASLGFGFVEVGTVTADPQPGNPRPRMFRLPEDEALVNRLGFNNDGAAVVAERLLHVKRRCIVGVNIGKNKDVPNVKAVESYAAALKETEAVADYIAVNISSPNTPGLRDLQQGEHLDDLLSTLKQTCEKPILVKIAPDLEEKDIEDIVGRCLTRGIAGIIATNSTIERDGLKTPITDELKAGGLSGRPLAAGSNRVIAHIFRLAGKKLPVIGVGGVFTAEDAFEKVAAGASLIQAYTGFVYGGPTFPADVCTGLRRILSLRGFVGLEDAVGSAAHVV